MQRVLLPNLFFEEELQSITAIGSVKSRQLVAELGPTMGLLAGEFLDTTCSEEISWQHRVALVVNAGSQPDDIPAALQHVEYLTLDQLSAVVRQDSRSVSARDQAWDAIPWGWSDVAVSTCQKVGLQVRAPDIDVVRWINSRQFQAQFDVAVEMEGVGRLESFGTLCRSHGDVIAAINAACEFSQHGWVIKADLSHASRNRLIGKSNELGTQHLAWLESHFAFNECVYVEPWVHRVSECGLQFFVPHSEDATAKIEFVGATEMLTNDAGHYQGSVLRPTWHEGIWQPAIEHCFGIAKSAAAMGYFGPLGIDCMVFRSPGDGRHWLRLSHDINGRLTMGRIALSLRKYLSPDEFGIWIHSVANTIVQNGNIADEISSNGVRIMHTSPGRIGGKLLRTRTVLLISADPEHLRATSTQILRQSLKITQKPGSVQDS